MCILWLKHLWQYWVCDFTGFPLRSAIQWDEVFYSRQAGNIIFYHRIGTAPHPTVLGMESTALCMLHSILPCGCISTVLGGGVWSEVLGSLKSTMYLEVILNSQMAGYAAQAGPELQLKWMRSSENRNVWRKWCEIILSTSKGVCLANWISKKTQLFFCWQIGLDFKFSDGCFSAMPRGSESFTVMASPSTCS